VSPFLPELLLSVGDWTFRLWHHGIDSQVALFVSPQAEDMYTAGAWVGVSVDAGALLSLTGAPGDALVVSQNAQHLCSMLATTMDIAGLRSQTVTKGLPHWAQSDVCCVSALCCSCLEPQPAWTAVLGYCSRHPAGAHHS
jgi:hypothetical protein